MANIQYRNPIWEVDRHSGTAIYKYTIQAKSLLCELKGFLNEYSSVKYSGLLCLPPITVIGVQALANARVCTNVALTW